MFSDLPFIITLRSILEILYFIGGIIVAIAAVLALKQLKIAKYDIDIRSKRECATLTSEQCKFYAETIIPLAGQISIKLTQAKIKEYSGKVSSFCMCQEVFEWLKSLTDYSGCEDILNDIVKFNNELEAFSIYFIHGICDEEMAFNPIASDFISNVTMIYPIICLSHDKNENSYKNMIKLYEIWKNRYDKIKLEMKTQEMKKQYLETIAQVSSMKQESINPIGISKKSNSQNKQKNKHK